jgi:argininosuccinate synthase
VLDWRDEFVSQLIMPALRAGAFGEDRARLVTALGAPMVARALVEVGRIEQAHVLAHGGEPGGRVERSVRSLNRDVGVISHGWPASASAEVRRWVRPSPPAPGPAFVDLSFDAGLPVAINGVAMPTLDLIASLTTIAGAHGIGRPGARGLVESPALTVLETGLRALQNAAASPETQRFSAVVAREYADIIVHGLWFSPLREALDAYVGRVQAGTTGHVRLTLFNGHCDVHDDTLVRAV